MNNNLLYFQEFFVYNKLHNNPTYSLVSEGNIFLFIKAANLFVALSLRTFTCNIYVLAALTLQQRVYYMIRQILADLMLTRFV